jgi:hypothetical protein
MDVLEFNFHGFFLEKKKISTQRRRKRNRGEGLPSPRIS